MDRFKGKSGAYTAVLAGSGGVFAGSVVSLIGKLNLVFSFLVALTVENKSTTNISSCLQDCDFDSDFISQFFIKLTEGWWLRGSLSYNKRITPLRVNQYILHEIQVSKLLGDRLSISYINFLTSQQTFVGLQDMSWRRLQHVFGVTIFRLPRRLVNTSWRRLEDIPQDILKMSWSTLKTSWRRIQDMIEDVLKTCEDVLEKTKCLLGISVSNHGLLTNLNQYLTNLYLTNLYFTDLRRIQNALIRTQ